MCVCVHSCVCMHILAGEADYMPKGIEDHIVKNPYSNARDPGSIPRWGRSPGEGHGNPLHYSCLENPTDTGAWRAAVYGVAKSHARLTGFFTLWVGALKDAEMTS